MLRVRFSPARRSWPLAALLLAAAAGMLISGPPVAASGGVVVTPAPGGGAISADGTGGAGVGFIPGHGEHDGPGPDDGDEMEPADEGTFDPATGTNTVDPTTGHATINLDTESTTHNGTTVVNVTDGTGTTVVADVADLPAGTTDITVSVADPSDQAVADALAAAGLPAGTMAFGVEIDISDQNRTNIGGTTPVTVQFELPAGFDPATSAVVWDGEIIPVTVVSLGPPVVVQASLPRLTIVLFVEIVEEEVEEEPMDEVDEVVEEEPPAPAPEVLSLNAGGQFLFWAFGAAQAADVFGTVKIAWLFDSTTINWTSFIPVLGITNFALSEGAVLWIVTDAALEIVLPA